MDIGWHERIDVSLCVYAMSVEEKEKAALWNEYLSPFTLPLPANV